MQNRINAQKKINVEIRIKPSIESSLDTTNTSLQVGTKKYHFNKVHITTTQKQLFDYSVMPLISQFLDGYNCTVLAYGQTGSGKTYTMGISHDDTSGIVPQTLGYLFSKDCTLTCTFIEVYNEEVIDLLTEHKVPLNLRDNKGDVIVAGVREISLNNINESLEILKKGCLERTTKSTKMNSQSSRSHAIFTIFFTKNNITSKFSFVDLAGSERLKRTLCTGDRARESISINGGLLALGNVISALYLKKPHIPFRDSKLTRILQSCLNGHVLMIACVSSLHTDINETNNTLKYANRTASISMTVKRNVEIDVSKYELIKLKKQIITLTNENQILKERIKKVNYANVEELIKENRRLKNMIDNEISNRENSNKSEDLAQVIVKHPFVQNLMNENEQLRCKLLEQENCKLKFNDVFKENNVQDNLKKVQNVNESISLVSNLQDNYVEDNCIVNKTLRNNIQHDILNTKNDTINKKDDIINKSKNDTINSEKDDIINKSKNDQINKKNDILKSKNSEKDDILNKSPKSNMISWCDNKNINNVSKIPKRVTFDISPPKKKSSLWTPRKERVLMDTSVIDKFTGYIAHNMVIYQNKLVFSSFDNKLRIKDPNGDVYDLFTDTGIKCIYSDDLIYYSTRMILKQGDPRSKTVMPVYAYKNEISCIFKNEYIIFTGHEDGTLSCVDLRNISLQSDKIHSRTIFTMELLNNVSYTGSRDHTIKGNVFNINQSVNNNFINRKTLYPPHYDAVHSLLNYKGDLISLSRDCSLKRWRDGLIIKTVPNAHSSWIKCGTSLQDCFVTGSKNGTLRFWDYCEDSVFCVGSYKTGQINCMVKWNEGVFVGSQNKEIVYLISKYKT